MNEEESNELDELLLAHQEDGLDDPQRERLKRILKDSPEARAQVVQQQWLDAALHLEQSSGVEMAPLPEPPRLEMNRRSSLGIGWLGIAATVVLALGIGLGLGVLFSGSSPELVDEAVEEPTDNSVALLNQALDVDWQGGQSFLPGALLSPGKLEFSAGLLQIEFYSGVRLIIEGPAKIELLGSNEAICHRGKLRAHVPDHARGFTIHSPKFQLVDLGTEFGIAVAPNGAAEVQVFDGEVELYRPDRRKTDQKPLHRLLGGSGITWNESGDTARHLHVVCRGAEPHEERE